MSATLKTCLRFYGAAAIVGLFFTYLQISPVSQSPFAASIPISSIMHAFCGNGVVDTGEECDYYGRDGAQAHGQVCNGNSNSAVYFGVQCKYARCGDLYINGVAGETCDNGDGIVGKCVDCRYVWSGYSTSSFSMQYLLSSASLVSSTSFTSSASPVCGNSRIEGEEQCDDGNTLGGDGCAVSCQVETSCLCEGQPSRCACWHGSSSSIPPISSSFSSSTPSLWWYWWFEKNSSTSTSASPSSSAQSVSSQEIPRSASSAQSSHSSMSAPSSSPHSTSPSSSPISSAPLSSSSPPSGICGNQKLERGERCETWQRGDLTIIQGCGFGLYCQKCAQCALPMCGDSVTNLPLEKCDPPGSPGGACSGGQVCASGCKTCTGGASSSTAPELCGNGSIDGSEKCDWTFINGQRYTIGCQQAQPYCNKCTQCSLCGNGRVDSGETCDPPGGVCSGGGTCGDQCEVCTAASSSQIRIGYVGVVEKTSILERTLDFLRNLGLRFAD